MSELVSVEVKIFPSIEQEAKMVYLNAGKSWMDPIISYIRDRTLPIDKGHARKLKCQVAKYTLVDVVLYLRGYTLPLLRCLNDEEVDYVLRQIHDVICGNHSRVRSLAFKSLKQWYFWPTMHQDAHERNKNCKSCQSFANFLTQPPEKLTLMSSPWPFAQ